jgi:hypothetical protein
MAEESKKYLEDVVLYQYADVAKRLSSKEETLQFAEGALERLVSDFEKILGEKKEILDGFKAGAFASQEGIETAIKIYAEKYQKALNNLDFTEFYDIRAGILKSILGEKEAEKAKSVFEKYKGQTLGSVRKKFEQANVILKDKTGLFDEKKKEEAKKTIEKLTPIYNLINLLENKNYEELMPNATKSVYKKLISHSLEKA